MSRGGRVVLLDRDGTINVERDHLIDPDQVELLPGAAAGIRMLADLGLPVVVVTNQSVIGRGWIGHEAVDRINARLGELLAADGARVDAFLVCPHVPDDGCACRKPAAGLARRAASMFGADLTRSFVVGDQASDVDLGRATGATVILVRTGYGARTESAGTRPDHVAPDLRGAAEIIRGLVGAPL